MNSVEVNAKEQKKNMKGYIATMVSIATICLIFSSATAVPYSVNRHIIEKIAKNNDLKSSLKADIGNTDKNLNGINRLFLERVLPKIGVLLGLLYIALGLGFLFLTLGSIMMVLLAFALNPWPGAIVFAFFAAIEGILSMIFLIGGFALLFNNNPTVAVMTLIAIFLMSVTIVIYYLLQRIDIDGQSSTINTTILGDEQVENDGG